MTKTRRKTKLLANIIFIMKVFISSPYLQLADLNAKMCLYLYAISKIFEEYTNTYITIQRTFMLRLIFTFMDENQIYH